MKTKLLAIILILNILFVSITATAQNNCGADQAEEKLLLEHPEIIQQQISFRQQLNDFILSNKQNLQISRAGNFTKVYIPVVFHILHDNGVGNLSDATIYQEMQNLNEYWNAENADLANLVSYFDSIKGDMKVEFRLAHIDPQGNCTNGIERINTNVTYFGNDVNKLHEWNPLQYINIWTCKKMTNEHNGVAAYAYRPCKPIINGKAIDGVLSLSSQIGLPPNSSSEKYVLAHELGHSMDLCHTFGCSTNSTGICGDDEVFDTPPTNALANCANLQDRRDTACWQALGYPYNANTIPNIQNIMNYAGCSVNFTKGQAEKVRAVLDLAGSCRNVLWQPTNLIATGTQDPYTQFIDCNPVADFGVDKRTVCVGGIVKFTDFSYNGTINNYSWTFPADASVTTANTATVNVSFATAGWKNIELTVSNSIGSSTTQKMAVYVEDNANIIQAPYQETFENGANGWLAVSNDIDNTTFAVTNTGLRSQQCMFLNNYNSIKDGEYNSLISPAFNTQNLPSNSTLSFYAAVAKGFGGSIDDSLEVLNVYASKDCGATWVPLKTKGYSKSDLINAGIVTNYFVAGQTDDYWRKYSLPLTMPIGMDFFAPSVKFKFEFQSSHNGNNFFIDNINVGSASTGIESEFTDIFLKVFPNPTTKSSILTIESEINSVFSIKIIDLLGNLVETVHDGFVKKGENTFEIGDSIVSSGVYFIRVESNGKVVSKKLIKL